MSLFYYPDTNRYFDPKKFALTYEDGFLNSADGNKINYWYFPSQSKTTKGLVVFFHGNAENISSHFGLLAWLPKESYSYIIFDYPGYGQSSGTPTPESTVQAGLAAVRYAAKAYPNAPLFLYGQSLGGNIVQKVANEIKHEIPVKAIVLESTFTSYGKVARHALSKSWISWAFQPITYLVVSNNYAGHVEEISPTPLLIIHGISDRVIGYKMGEELYQKAKEPKQFLTIPNGDHGNTYFINNGLYRKDLLNFLDQHSAQSKN